MSELSNETMLALIELLEDIKQSVELIESILDDFGQDSEHTGLVDIGPESNSFIVTCNMCDYEVKYFFDVGVESFETFELRMDKEFMDHLE